MKSVCFRVIFLPLIIMSCTSSEDTTRQIQSKEAEVYLFEDVKKPDSVKVEKTAENHPDLEVKFRRDSTGVSKTLQKYYIQLGAFNTQERAQIFVNENQSKIAYIMNISLRESDKKFIVRLKSFSTKEEAEIVKNNIRQISSFKDAFIPSVE